MEVGGRYERELKMKTMMWTKLGKRIGIEIKGITSTVWLPFNYMSWTNDK